MWGPLGNIWVILGDRKQAYLPAVRPFTHHICPHSTVKPSKPARAICHHAPCSAQVHRTDAGLSLIHRLRWSFCLKISISRTLQSWYTLHMIYNSFLLFYFQGQATKIKKSHIWKGGSRGMGFEVSSIGHISMQKCTSRHIEQENVCTHVCYGTGAPSCILKQFWHWHWLQNITLPQPPTCSSMRQV